MFNKKGFTLIELLVVISIIGLLSSIVLASLKSARSKARDGERISEMRQVQRALELYYDKYGQYPATDWVSSIYASWNTGSNPLYALVTEGFIDELPVDPINNHNAFGAPSATTYAYTYFSRNYPSPGGSGKWYMLVFNLENPHSIQSSDGVQSCSLSNTFHYGTNDNRITLGGDCTMKRI